MNKLRYTFLIAPIYLFSLLFATAHGKNIVIATSSVVLTNTPIWVGIDRKLFEDAGLRVEYVVMRSDLAVKGLITGARSTTCKARRAFYAPRSQGRPW